MGSDIKKSADGLPASDRFSSTNSNGLKPAISRNIARAAKQVNDEIAATGKQVNFREEDAARKAILDVMKKGAISKFPGMRLLTVTDQEHDWPGLKVEIYDRQRSLLAVVSRDDQNFIVDERPDAQRLSAGLKKEYLHALKWAKNHLSDPGENAPAQVIRF